jgi:hypothetical protein
MSARSPRIHTHTRTPRIFANILIGLRELELERAKILRETRNIFAEWPSEMLRTPSRERLTYGEERRHALFPIGRPIQRVYGA